MDSMTKKILLVEDDSDDRDLFRMIIKEFEEAELSASVENGIDMIAFLSQLNSQSLPDLIILDQNMPKMTGKESLIYLKQHEQFRRIPVVMYSTYQSQDFFEECRQLGAVDVLSKPDTFEAYRAMIKHCIQ